MGRARYEQNEFKPNFYCNLGIVVAFSNFETVMILAGIALIIEGLKRLIITLVCAGKIREAKKQLMNAANEIIIE